MLVEVGSNMGLDHRPFSLCYWFAETNAQE